MLRAIDAKSLQETDVNVLVLILRLRLAGDWPPRSMPQHEHQSPLECLQVVVVVARVISDTNYMLNPIPLLAFVAKVQQE